MSIERENSGNQPNSQRGRGGSDSTTQSPSTPTPTQPGRDRYAEDAPDSSRQYGEMGNRPNTGQGQGGSSGGTSKQSPPVGGSTRPTAFPSTGGPETNKSETCDDDSCSTETGINKNSRQPETGKRSSISGGHDSKAGGPA